MQVLFSFVFKHFFEGLNLCSFLFPFLFGDRLLLTFFQ